MIIYYERYVVIQAGVKAQEGLNYLDFLTEEEYLQHLRPCRKRISTDEKDPNKFIAKMGAEA